MPSSGLSTSLFRCHRCFFLDETELQPKSQAIISRILTRSQTRPLNGLYRINLRSWQLAGARRRRLYCDNAISFGKPTKPAGNAEGVIFYRL